MELRKSLLSSESRIQAPWIKVTIGQYTFGVFSNKPITKNAQGFYSAYKIQYPQYIRDLSITKINGQVNQYTLNIEYPVTPTDDPNFFEKVFSSVSNTRKIIFSYGDSSAPGYIYKDEEAIITNISTTFNFGSSGSSSAIIGYSIRAVSSAALGKQGNFSFFNSGRKKPSDEIKRIFADKTYGLQSLFTGMRLADLDKFIVGDDKTVELENKTNTSPLDYINYLVGCMIPSGSTLNTISKEMYILTLHDDTVYDSTYNNSASVGGPYFKVTKVSSVMAHSDAYEIDIGYNTNTIVTNFSIDNNENYSLYYNYQNELYPETYTRRLNDKGQWEEVYAPVSTSNNTRYNTKAEDTVWFTKLTQYPIKARITIQGLLRPAQLLQYVRLNIIFPGGIGDDGIRKHISSGLYIITSQQDSISGSGYRTTLGLTKISN